MTQELKVQDEERSFMSINNRKWTRTSTLLIYSKQTLKSPQKVFIAIFTALDTIFLVECVLAAISQIQIGPHQVTYDVVVRLIRLQRA